MSLRLLWTSWRLTFTTLSLSRFFVLSAIVQPIIFATIAYYTRLPRGDETLDVALGAALIGAWSATVYGSGALLHWERWQRTLELLVASPTRFVGVLAPLTLAAASLGLYSFAATFLWMRLAFGMELHLENPVAFAAALVTGLISLALLGLLLASVFIFSRHATVLVNFIGYPVWIVSGLLVPVSLLPRWAEVLGWTLAPTWAMRALAAAAAGDAAFPAIAACCALAVLYLALGAVFVDVFLRLARRRATLALA